MVFQFPILSQRATRSLFAVVALTALVGAHGVGSASAQSGDAAEAGRAGTVLERFGLDQGGSDGPLQSQSVPAWDTPVDAGMDVGLTGPLTVDRDRPTGTSAGSGLAVPVSDGFVTDGFDPPAEIRLITPLTGTGDLSAIPAGLEVVLDEGWKSYWRAPGAAGLPPALHLAGTTNLADLTLEYPTPERFSLFGLDTFGYAERVVYPLTLTPGVVGDGLSIEATVDILVCSDICVPVTDTVSLALPSGPPDPDATITQDLDRWRAQVPQDSFSSGLDVTGAGWDGQELVVTASIDPPVRDAGRLDVLVEAAGDWFFAAPVVTLAATGDHFTARIAPLERGAVGDLTGNPVRLTVMSVGETSQASRALDWQGGVGVGAPVGAASGGGGLSLPTILLFAILGGLLLNVMPCVLPVLSLKLFSLIQDGGKAPSEARRGLLITAAGILASFWVLAGGLIALDLAGGAIGWGIQFQQPVFLIFMITLLALFAANLAGLFEITLPDRVGQMALAGSSGSGWVGQFGTGAFATLLATPCSAPFLGTAVGFALARGPIDILAVFTALAVGFALPYLLVAAVPGAVRLLPKPGAWMVKVKYGMALALAGTAVWLLTVLAIAADPLAAGLVAGLAILAIAVIALPGIVGQAGLGRPGAGLAAVLLLAALATPALPTAAWSGNDGSSPLDEAWEPWSVARLDEAVAGGQVVFVDVTAEWCLTCVANKRLVLDRGEVLEALADPAILPLQADWTRPDPAIAAYLADHSRYGIPFNVVYGPGAPTGIILPELLTEGAVMDALAAAGAPGLAAQTSDNPG